MKANHDSTLAMYRSVAALLAASPAQMARVPLLLAKFSRLTVKIDRLISEADTETFEPTMLEIDFLLEREIDPLLHSLKASEPQFYRSYRAARAIPDELEGSNLKATTVTAISTATAKNPAPSAQTP